MHEQHHPGGRTAGIAGLVFVATGLFSVFAPGQPPAGDAGVDEIRAYLADSRSVLLLAGWLAVIGTVSILLYLGHLHHDVVGSSDGLGAAFLMGGAVAAGAGVLGTLMFITPGWSKGFVEAAEPGIIQLAWNASYLLYCVAVASTGVVLGIYALRAFEGAAPRWSAWLAAAAGVVCLAGSIGALGPGPSMLMFAGYLSWLVFVTATSVAMLTSHAPSHVGAVSPA